MIAGLRRAFRLARWFVTLEIGIWRSLFLWVTRRVPGRRPGVETFAYSRDIVPILAAISAVSTVELVVVHVLLPWETIRLIADVISIWGLLWMLGLLASLRVFPHLVADDALHVRYGTTVDVAVPWEAVASVTARRRGGVTSRKSVWVDGAVVTVAVLKQTRVDVVLREPTRLELPDGPETVTEVRLYVDNPRAFVTAARERIPIPR